MSDILSVDGLSLRVANRVLLEGGSFSLARGETVWLLDAEGSGKTALLKAIAGLLVPLSGEIRVLDLPPSPVVLSEIAYLPDCAHLPEALTPSELVRLFAKMFADFDAERATALLHDLRVNTQKKLSALSRGTRDKIRLILTMSRRVSLYLLDEPLGKADATVRDYVLHLITANKKEGASVLIATQNTSLIEEMLDSFLLLSEGKLTLSNKGSGGEEANGTTLDAHCKGDTVC